MSDIIKYLKDNWNLCIRENRFDDDTLIGLPYKYTVPSTEQFNELYYWDTYFTNIGLIKLGKAELAKNNVDNMLFLVGKYGFMPNGNRTYYLSRSQPPFLSEMVKDIYNYYKDDVWLIGAYAALEKEYAFWNTKRNSPIGLNHYDSYIDPKEEKDIAASLIGRLGMRPSGTDFEIARHYFATAESGWDMNPRWDFEAYNFAAVELNSLLYGFENNMAYFADIIGKSSEHWKTRADERLQRMQKYMLDDNDIFTDYNFVSNKHSKVFSAASYFPLFVKAASKKQAQALVDNLSRLEESFGISACEAGSYPISYQWDYPNGWACLQHIVIAGLSNYGYDDIAKRIAEKYVSLTEKIFAETGSFWEKYNVAEGNINVSNEYKMPPMLGWSAGIYVYAKNLLNN